MAASQLDATATFSKTPEPERADPGGPADGLGGRTLSIVLYEHEKDNEPQPIELTWAELVTKLSEVRTARCTLDNCAGHKCPHKLGRAWAPNRYHVVTDVKRGKDGVAEMTAMVLDLDHLTFDECSETIRRMEADGLRGIMHTTHSHREDSPRGRIVLALSRPAIPSEWPRLWRAVVEKYAPGADHACSDVSHMYFLPSRPTGAPAECGELSGDQPLDVDALLALVPPEEPSTPRAIPAPATMPARWQEAADLLASVFVVGTRHNASLAIAGALAGMGLRADAINAFLARVNEQASPPGDHHKRLDHASRAVDRVGMGETVRGWPTLIDEVGLDRAVVRRAASLLGVTLTDDDDPEFFARMAAQTEGEAPKSELASAAVTRPGSDRLTELGNACRMAEMFGDRLRYVHAWKSWLQWDGTRWKRTEERVEEAAAKMVTSALFERAADLAKLAADGDGKAAKLADDVLKWARRSSDARVIINTARLAQSELPLSAKASEFDTDPWALNVANGTIDLRTGDLRPHRQSDKHTMLAPVPYDPTATCPRWDALIAWAIPDEATRAWFQRHIGYCATGDVSEQIITFHHGGGDNGKSTVLGALKYVLGDYAMQGSPGLLMSPEHGGGEELARRLRANLKGRRFVLVQEIEAGRYMNEAQVKQITGGDTMTGAKLYENETEIMPTHKIDVGTNYHPIVRGRGHAIWRRIRIVPWLAKVADADKDPALPEKLKEEASGILAWIVRGCLAWQREGLKESALMKEAASKYRKSEDRLAEFLCDATEPGEMVDSVELYKVYVRWSEHHKETPWGRRAFINALIEDGYKADRASINSRQVRVVFGLMLRKAIEGGFAWAR